ncbi:MAG: hypothetical protein ACRDHF_02180 [Tepidiformaceae bacterium]
MKRTLSLSVLGAAVCAAILSITMLAGTTGAVGPNLVQNGDFSQGATQWPQYPGQTTTLVQPYFGALSITQTVDTPDGFGFSAVQCVETFSDLHEYTIEADLLVPSGQGRTGVAEVWAVPYSDPGCSGSSTISEGSAPVASDAWTHGSRTFLPAGGTQSMLVVLYGSMDPISGSQEPEDDFTVAFDNVSLTQGNRVNASVEICKDVTDNGDGVLDAGVFTFAVAVDAQQPFVTDLAIAADELTAGCAKLYLDDYGVQPGNLVHVWENPLAGWTNQANYPIVEANFGPFSYGATDVSFADVGANHVNFANKRVANEGGNLPAEPRSIYVCSLIDPNGDADTESMSWDYELSVQGQQVPFAIVPLNPTEGPAGACESVDLFQEGVANETAFTITQSVEPLWDDDPIYPAWEAGGTPGSGNSANFTYALGSGDTFVVTFQNKEAVVAPPADPTPDPTQTPDPTPDPTGTPTPPADDPDPDPTGTPTPPANDPDPDPTGTPTPPADDPDPDPTGTPTPPANDPDPDPTGTPTPPADDPDPTGTPTPPAGDPDPDPTGTPEAPDGGLEQQDDGTPASETATDGGPAAPLPPSAGSGKAPSTGSSGRDTLIGTLLVALGGLSTAGSLAWRKAGNRPR